MSDSHRKRLRRIDEPGTARFLTFSCYRRLPLFNNDRIKDRFVEALVAAAVRHAMQILAWVVMPEHVHLIVYPLDGQSLTPFLTTLKRTVAADVVGRWRELEAAILPRITDTRGDAHFWQAGGGYDRNVVGRELIEKIRYVHANPIRRGLVNDAVAWAWSSARRYVGQGDVIGPPIAMDLIPEHSGDLV